MQCPFNLLRLLHYCTYLIWREILRTYGYDKPMPFRCAGLILPLKKGRGFFVVEEEVLTGGPQKDADTPLLERQSDERQPILNIKSANGKRNRLRKIIFLVIKCSFDQEKNPDEIRKNHA